VPKQEKKKKPTGRAMKRIKYNRRFVNVGEFLAAGTLAQWLARRCIARISAAAGCACGCMSFTAHRVGV
jgi:hypothetical protein